MSFLNSINLDAWRVWAPLGIAGIIVWALWLYRVRRARGSATGRQRLPDHARRSSFPPTARTRDILISAWPRGCAQDPTEVIVVVDVDDIECQAALAEIDDPRCRRSSFEHEGKRSALGVGIRAAVGRGRGAVRLRHDVDRRDCSRRSRCRSSDPHVGAVGTQQNVYQRTTSIWRRIADWMVNLRYYDYVPGHGPQGCGDLRIGAHRGLPALGHRARAAQPGARVLPRAADASPATTGG